MADRSKVDSDLVRPTCHDLDRTQRVIRPALQNVYHTPRRFSSPRSTEDFPESRMGNQADGRANTNRIEGRDTLYHRTVLFLNLRPTLGHFRRSSSIIGKQHNPRRGATKPMKRDSRWMFNLHLG